MLYGEYTGSRYPYSLLRASKLWISLFVTEFGSGLHELMFAKKHLVSTYRGRLGFRTQNKDTLAGRQADIYTPALL